jgi:hypothetical protein
MAKAVARACSVLLFQATRMLVAIRGGRGGGRDGGGGDAGDTGDDDAGDDDGRGDEGDGGAGIGGAISTGRPLSNSADSIALSCRPAESASDRFMTMQSNSRPWLPRNASPSRRCHSVRSH